MTGSPIKYTIFGYSQLVTKQIMYYATRHKMYDVFSSELFQKINKQINDDYDLVMKKGINKKEMIEKYAYSLDVFELGITIVHAIIRNKENYEKYRPLVEYMINLSEPPRSAAYALNFFKKFKQRGG